MGVIASTADDAADAANPGGAAKLTAAHRHAILDGVLPPHGQDNEAFLRKLKARMDR